MKNRLASCFGFLSYISAILYGATIKAKHFEVRETLASNSLNISPAQVGSVDKQPYDVQVNV